jgi:hypothetical protein
MPASLKSSRRRLRIGWFAWPLALLALPNCILETGGLGIPPTFQGGPEPQSDAIMCDIPKVPGPDGDCANSTETGFGLPLERAAVALAQGQSQSLALDFSDEATTACGGSPRKVEFYGPFPDGYTVCLNCGTQMPVPYATATAACIAKCIDLVEYGEFEPPGGATKYCQDNAKVSTNFDDNTCFDDVCSSGGTLKPDFKDPRREQESVKWVDVIGAADADNDLTRNTPPSGDFDAGATSDQKIGHGDAWVEFEAGQADTGHVVGLSTDAGADANPAIEDVAFGIRLRGSGEFSIVESGIDVSAILGNYVAGERFRVRVTDNRDGTATISYTRLIGACTPGTVCNEVQIGSQTAASPSYPLRAYARLAGDGSSVLNVTLVRIK